MDTEKNTEYNGKNRFSKDERQLFLKKGEEKNSKDRGNALSEEELMAIRQTGNYNKYNKATPDNNPFFESRNNPLSSKGN